MPTDAKALADEAAELIDALPDEELARRLDAARPPRNRRDVPRPLRGVGRHAERALAIGRATGQGDLFPLIFPMLGTALWLRGRMAESAELFDGAIEGARLVENVQALAWNLFNRSIRGDRRGRHRDRARDRRGERRARARARREHHLLARGLGARLGAARDRPRRAGRRPALDLDRRRGAAPDPGGWRAYGLELLTRCLLEAGRRPEAERTAAHAAACAETVGLPRPAAMAARAAALLALDAGDAAGAAERALAAAAALEECGAAYRRRGARGCSRGARSPQAGEPDRAAAELERAAAAFDSFGADRYRAEAERELRKLGRRIHHRTQPGKSDGIGVGSLTERELEVARLIVDRKTNPEIAAALFLSQKTVETHIRNMFRKVGVASRIELARAVERADRAESAASQ